MDRPRLVILVGPTGAGKSRLALELAETFGGEVISADSMQVYKTMDIGTDKPAPEVQKRVPHHLIDLVYPDQPFHAGLYQTLGREIIRRLHREQKRIWVVGGTGLYVKALTQGMFQSPPIDSSVRERLRRVGEEKGWDSLYRTLAEVDARTALRVHPNDHFRILRALEVFESTGSPISSFRERHGFEDRPYTSFKIGLEMDREKLYGRIDERVDRMIAQGFLEEVRGLLDRGYDAQLKPMQGLGYKHLVRYLLKKVGWEEAIHQIKQDTRHYAKRQWTWFKSDPEVMWRNEAWERTQIVDEVTFFLREGQQ